MRSVGKDCFLHKRKKVEVSASERPVDSLYFLRCFPASMTSVYPHYLSDILESAMQLCDLTEYPIFRMLQYLLRDTDVLETAFS